MLTKITLGQERAPPQWHRRARPTSKLMRAGGCNPGKYFMDMYQKYTVQADFVNKNVHFSGRLVRGLKTICAWPGWYP
jgi:hypothetical protein